MRSKNPRGWVSNPRFELRHETSGTELQGGIGCAHRQEAVSAHNKDGRKEGGSSRSLGLYGLSFYPGGPALDSCSSHVPGAGAGAGVAASSPGLGGTQ